MTTTNELALKLEKRNKINEGEIAPPTLTTETNEKTSPGKKKSKENELAMKLDKRNKINEGKIEPPTLTKETKQTSASDELASKLEKRHKINEGELSPTMNNKGISVYSENPNLSRKTIHDLQDKFNEIATKHNKESLNLSELKTLFENLGCPQTHITLKTLLKDCKQDPNTGSLTFRQFLSVFKMACADEELDEDSPLRQLAAMNEINVGTKGVSGAAEFFQAKMKASGDNSFAKEVEREKLKQIEEEEEARRKQEAFKQMKSKFCTS